MNVKLKSGKYIVAISGGVDSMVLLDLLMKTYATNKNYQFIVTHFNHGIRIDSDEDQKLVANIANKYHLVFESYKANLGANVSENFARQSRYSYLRNVMKKHQADYIITGHHQDDVIETAIFNVIRGTGRKGLTSLGQTNEIKRPLLNYSKKDILKYAKYHKIFWREDSTNKDIKYSRNFIREEIISKFSNTDYSRLLGLINRQRVINVKLDNELKKILSNTEDINHLDRSYVVNLPASLASELIASWLRINQLLDFDKKTIYRILNGSRISKSGMKYDVKHNFYVIITKQYLALKHTER